MGGGVKSRLLEEIETAERDHFADREACSL